MVSTCSAPPWSGSRRLERGLMEGPVPGHQLFELVGGMPGDAGEDVGQPSLGIDVVKLCGDDETVQDGGTLAAAIGAGEQPGLAAQGQAAQGPFGGVVRQADPPVGEEARKGG